MTIFYPDLSSYQAGYKIPAGTPAVVAKATEGTYYLDSSFHDFQHQATVLGIPFSGYHFLKSESSPEAQAQYYYNFAGKIPCMIDCETSGGSTPGVDWCLRFKKALESLGGRVWSVYYPHWYLGVTGGSLDSLGVPVIASEYRSYDDNNWPASYGGITPQVWQYTSTPIDMNAFKGTAEQLFELITGETVITSADAAAIASAVYEHGEETIFSEPHTKVPLGNLVHGAWVSTNDPNGPVLKALAELQATLNQLVATLSAVKL